MQALFIRGHRCVRLLKCRGINLEIDVYSAQNVGREVQGVSGACFASGNEQCSKLVCNMMRLDNGVLEYQNLGCEGR